jgi:hypothetical protein
MAFLSRRAVLWTCVAAFFAASLVSAPAGAQRAQMAEQALKAAFLYNFTKFIDWPESAFPGRSTPFKVCVLADDAFRREVEGILRNEQVRGRPIQVRLPETSDDLKTCHLVYFGADEAERFVKRLPALRKAPVLTVGEGPRFLEHGGLIAFLLVSDRVRFDISKRGAEAAGLSVSSKLLRVARNVVGIAP